MRSVGVIDPNSWPEVAQPLLETFFINVHPEPLGTTRATSSLGVVFLEAPDDVGLVVRVDGNVGVLAIADKLWRRPRAAVPLAKYMIAVLDPRAKRDYRRVVAGVRRDHGRHIATAGSYGHSALPRAVVLAVNEVVTRYEAYLDHAVGAGADVRRAVADRSAEFIISATTGSDTTPSSVSDPLSVARTTMDFSSALGVVWAPSGRLESAAPVRAICFKNSRLVVLFPV